MSKLTVTYIKHSGFLVETANSYLLFDYWQGKLPELQYDKEPVSYTHLTLPTIA